MFKNTIKLVLIAVLMTSLSGCADILKKFIPKKKEGRADYSFYQVEDYKPRPAPERYVKNYTLWHNWHIELERPDDTNYIRDVFNANESLKYLIAMRDLLQDEQAKKLDVQINEMNGVIERIEKRHERVKDNVNNQRTVERVGRIVQDEFSYKRMQKYIKIED